jgi:Na+-transporting NADH:ubiquinone oxidoreductase subunit NqrD
MRRLHGFAAFVATACVATFLVSTIAVEMLGSESQVAAVKQGIVYGMAVLVPAIALAGITGARMAKGRVGRDVERKRGRMPFLAANGLLVLVPAALYLNHLAAERSFGSVFYLIQGVELLAGAVNVRWLMANVFLGRRLARKEM